MAHEPKLTAYIIELKTSKSKIENSFRNLYRQKIGEVSNEILEDSYIFLELCKRFISEIDKEEMYSDEANKKCFTANQVDITDENINPNIIFHSESQIIEGIVEGGSYGKKRSKTSTYNKTVKDIVSEKDAITDDFYFLIYTPLNSKKSILLIQSYTDDNIDNVMRKFWKNFLTFPEVFNAPTIVRFIPKKIIQDFKQGATISNITYSTEIPSETLLGNSTIHHNQNYKVTIKIEPTDENLTPEEFDNIIKPIEESTFKFSLNLFKKKKGTLRDNQNGKTTPFEIGKSSDIKPNIVLSKYITILNDESDFDRIKDYCFQILEDIKEEIYIQNAIQER